jgi:transposase
MIQLAPQLKVLLSVEPVDFRKGIDGLVALCKTQLDVDPFSGTLFVFRNRAGTALKLLAYDGTGYWLSRRFHNASMGI